MSQEHDPLVIVQKYESFINYFYPVAQNIPRQHGVVREMFIQSMIRQVDLFVVAARTNQVSRINEADAGLAYLRYWLRFLSDSNRRLITERQHQVGSVMLAEVGRLIGSWIARRRGQSK